MDEVITKEKTNSDLIRNINENTKEPISPPSYGINEKWVMDYIKQFGEEPSFLSWHMKSGEA